MDIVAGKRVKNMLVLYKLYMYLSLTIYVCLEIFLSYNLIILN
jgi:hypothetical protein